MGYYFRVFCTAETPPALGDALKWVGERGVTLQTIEGDTAVDQWGKEPVTLIYDKGQPPFAAELNRCEGDDSLCAQETREFLAMVEELKRGRKRDRVIEHLRNTKFIVACEIPTTQEFGDAGFHALDVFLAYFVVHANGMVQADGQGFYEMGKLLIELSEAA